MILMFSKEETMAQTGPPVAPMAFVLSKTSAAEIYLF